MYAEMWWSIYKNASESCSIGIIIASLRRSSNIMQDTSSRLAAVILFGAILMEHFKKYAVLLKIRGSSIQAINIITASNSKELSHLMASFLPFLAQLLAVVAIGISLERVGLKILLTGSSKAMKKLYISMETLLIMDLMLLWLHTVSLAMLSSLRLRENLI